MRQEARWFLRPAGLFLFLAPPRQDGQARDRPKRQVEGNRFGTLTAAKWHGSLSLSFGLINAMVDAPGATEAMLMLSKMVLLGRISWMRSFCENACEISD